MGAVLAVLSDPVTCYLRLALGGPLPQGPLHPARSLPRLQGRQMEVQLGRRLMRRLAQIHPLLEVRVTCCQGCETAAA